MSLFDLVASRDNAGLQLALAADPAAAGMRDASGASLLALSAYVGNADATAIIRTVLPAIDAHEAIIVGDLPRVEALLAEGWDANALAPDGFTPLGLAAFFRRPEILDLLLPLTRDVNERARNGQQVAALHAAAAMRDLPAVEKLLRAGADPNLPQQQGFLPLHTAADHDDAAMAGLLILAGADSALRNDKGHTAAEHARGKGHHWLADHLERAARPALPSP